MNPPGHANQLAFFAFINTFPQLQLHCIHSPRHKHIQALFFSLLPSSSLLFTLLGSPATPERLLSSSTLSSCGCILLWQR
ncbi:hypothetical protein ACSS6W_001852 [Trichoderma asperelloides]